MPQRSRTSCARHPVSVTLASVLTVVHAVYVVSAALASGGRGQFSPDTLQMRTQSEVLLPLTHVPIYRSSFKYDALPLATYLVATGYWSPRKADDPRGIPMFQRNRQWKDGQHVLHRQLVWRGDEWIAWTRSNPAKARVLWPRVLSAVRAEPARCRFAELLLATARGPETAGAFEQLADTFEAMPFP